MPQRISWKRITAAGSIVAHVAMMSAPVAAQEFVVGEEYQGRYRCDEQWRNATLIVKKIKGTDFEGTFTLSGRLFDINNPAALRKRGEAPSVSGKLGIDGGVVMRWRDKLLLRSEGSERTVTFEGRLSREGELRGALDYPGCDQVIAAPSRVGRVVVAAAGGAKVPPAAVVPATRNGNAEDLRPAQSDIDSALADTLRRILRYADMTQVIDLFADARYLNANFRNASPEFFGRARDVLAARRDAAITRLAEATMDFSDLTPTLEGVAAGALTAKTTIAPYRSLDNPRMQAAIAEYLRRRAGQWNTVGVADLVRGELAKAQTLDQLMFQRKRYISEVDDPRIPVVRDLLGFTARRASYFQKATILGGAIAPETSARPQAAVPGRAPNAEEMYDAFVASMTAVDTTLRNARHWCEQRATADPLWSLTTPPAAGREGGLTCSMLIWMDIGAEPMMPVVRFERGGCTAATVRGVWRCNFSVNANARSTELSLLASVVRGLSRGPTGMFERRPTEEERRTAMTGAIDSRYDDGYDEVQKIFARAMSQIPIPMSARFEVRQGRWVMTEDQ